MSQTPSPMGIRVNAHKSGDPRFIVITDGIASGLAQNIFTGTPVKLDATTNLGTIIPATTGAADPIYGVFAGCEYTRPDGTRYIGPMWASGATYVAGSCRAKIVPINDPGAIFMGQTKATVANTARGQGINLGDNTQGSNYTGLSSQGLGAPTGATAASFTILDVVEQPDNAWGDPYVWVTLQVQTPQGAIA